MIYEKLMDQEDFNESEKTLARYIVNNVREVIFQSIDTIAEKSYSSPSSIVRFSKKLGCSGFTDLKINLAAELHQFSKIDERIEVDMPILPNSNTESILKSFYNLSTQSLDTAFQTLDRNAVKKAAKLLNEADAVTILGNGPSHLVALSLHYNLKRLGLNSQCDTTIGFQGYNPRPKVRKEVSVVISSFAGGEVVRQWINNLKNLNHTIILVTTNPKSPFCGYVDVVLSVDLSENYVWKVGAFASKTIMNYIVDVMYAELFNINYLENIKALYDATHRLGYDDNVDFDFIKKIQKHNK